MRGYMSARPLAWGRRGWQWQGRPEGSSEGGWLTGVEMRIEMDYGDGPVGAVDGAQERQRDGVVPPERDHPRERLPALCWAGLLGVGRRRPREDAVVALLDLVEGVRIVVSGSSIRQRAALRHHGRHGRYGRGHRDITAIQHGSPAVERVRVQRDIVSSADLCVRVTSVVGASFTKAAY